MQRDHFFPLDPERLLAWILADLEHGKIFDIPAELFFVPRPDDPFRLRHQGRLLETPLGVAAGPHTQMAQNIVTAWLCGARWIELKTVQILDELTITRPCIAAADEGYNCEWSQELRLDKSFEQYLLSYVLIHLLRHRLGFTGKEPGFAATMSVGYDLTGIQSPPVQRFLDRMRDCHAELASLRERLTPLYPALASLSITTCLADSLTLSTMHGCPPDEIERIGRYFLEERHLPTAIKLNPTLLGPERVRGIVNSTLGFDVEIPDAAFGHDLAMPQAMDLIRSLQDAAIQAGVHFSLKLTNTLETVNRGSGLPEREQMVYLSGRPLHPVAIVLADTLQEAFGGSLDISFCAGVDSDNIVDVLACGMWPVTVCTDLLKPGGYGRLQQYLDVLGTAMATAGAPDLTSLALTRAQQSDMPIDIQQTATLVNLHNYAAAVSANPRYRKDATPHRGHGVAKPSRALPYFDCAVAPCQLACPAGQDIPRYLDFTARGRMDLALATILATNPLPHTLSLVCDRQCRKHCVRGYNDAPLAIREIKDCATRAGNLRPMRPAVMERLDRRVGILGSGPTGLSCAWYLALAGYDVALYETDVFGGGRLDDGLIVLRDINGRPVLDREAIAAAFADQHGKCRAALATVADLEALLALGVTFQPGFPTNGLAILEARPVILSGPGVLPSAVGQGHRLAVAWLERQGEAGRLIAAPPDDRPRDAATLAKLTLRKARHDLAHLASPARLFDPSTASAEAGRCLQCDLICNICVSVCPNRANIALPTAPRRLPIQRVVREVNPSDGSVRLETLGHMQLTQPFQVVNLADLCNACGNCATFCPSSGAPYRDKPRWHLSEASFAADGEGYFLAAPGHLKAVRRGKTATLIVPTGRKRLRYIDATLIAELDPVTFEALSVELAQGIETADLINAVELALFFSLTDGRPPLASATLPKQIN
ncbi:putative selenate reductase [Desulfovibrionales bacterium]